MMMKYDVIAYGLMFRGEIEAESKEQAEQNLKSACHFPPEMPMIIQFLEEQKENNENA